MSIPQSVPPSWRRRGRAAYVAVGRRSAGLRVDPDFIVVGAQRCGTTSLFRALSQHPQIVRPTFNKGINYFDVHYDKGSEWYSGHFPTRFSAHRKAAACPGDPVVFEASGYYMFHPSAPGRIAADLPQVKLVAMLRDPVERAYSAWKHESARGFETEDFSTALALEDERLDGEVERMIADPLYQSFAHRHQAYRRRGQYADQLRDFLNHFDRSQLHVLYSESFFAEPSVEFARLCTFLDVDAPPMMEYDQHNSRPSRSMPMEARKRLLDHFRPLDSDLEEIVGRRSPWCDD